MKLKTSNTNDLLPMDGLRFKFGAMGKNVAPITSKWVTDGIMGVVRSSLPSDAVIRIVQHTREYSEETFSRLDTISDDHEMVPVVVAGYAADVKGMRCPVAYLKDQNGWKIAGVDAHRLKWIMKYVQFDEIKAAQAIKEKWTAVVFYLRGQRVAVLMPLFNPPGVVS